MHDVKNNEDESFEKFNFISKQEDWDHNQVEQDENGFTCYDPPVDKGLCRNDQIEHTLYNEGIESGLLHDSGNTDIRYSKEDRIHNDKGLSRWIRHSQ